MKRSGVLGIGTPVVDYIIRISHQFLKDKRMAQGGMHLVSNEEFETLLKNTYKPEKIQAGGSAANTIKGLAKFGHTCSLLGKIGNDETGKIFINRLQQAHVNSLLIGTATPTSKALCFVTPDGERTFRTFIGAKLENSDLRPEIFEGKRLVHIEGYLLHEGNLVKEAMRKAVEAGAKVSFDLSSFEVVEEYRELIIHLISEYVDVLFANEQETQALVGARAEKACDLIKDLCETVVLLEGKQGCWVGKGIYKVHCPALPVEALDSTGAGDLFASGFLHSYLEGKTLEESAYLGALTGRSVVQSLGAEIDDAEWAKILEEQQNNSSSNNDSNPNPNPIITTN